MKSNQSQPSGFTLIELVVIIIIAGIFLSIAAGALFSLGGLSKGFAEKSARNYIEQVSRINEKATLVYCLGADNDNDGTITCEFQISKIDDGKPVVEKRSMHCESTLLPSILNNGSCKPPRQFTGNYNLND